MAKVRVLAGDIEEGAWRYESMFGTADLKRDSTKKNLWGGERIGLKKSIQSLDQVTQENVKKLLGTAGWGLAGAALLGPLGAVGGLLLGGNKTEVVFTCELKDGRKFMASTDGKTWQKLLALTFG